MVVRLILINLLNMKCYKERKCNYTVLKCENVHVNSSPKQKVIRTHIFLSQLPTF